MTGVTITQIDPDTGTATAEVEGRTRTYVVDHQGREWFCTCRYTSEHVDPNCSHIRRAKEALGRTDPT